MPNTRHLVVLVSASLVVLMILIVVGLTMFKTFREAPTPLPLEQVTEAVLTPEVELAFQEQIAPLIKAGDMTACNQVQNDMYRKVCINNIALNKAEETKDISYCEHLDGTLVSKETCERQIIFQKSLIEGTAMACAETKNASLRKECEESLSIRLALEKKDPLLCDHTDAPDECRDAVVLTNFSANPNDIDCSAFSTEDAKTDCVSLKPLFALPVPDIARLTTICRNVKSQVFTRVCMNSGITPMQQQTTYEQQQ